MATRALPKRPPLVRCAGCAGQFGLEYDERGDPTAYHTLPYCPDFIAIETVTQALEHSEKCRMRLKPS